MTVNVTEPAAIAVTATAENAYTITFGTPDSISVTATMPNKGDKGDDGADGVPGAPGVGVPPGGDSGQVLAKIDGVDYNTEWVDPSGGTSKTANRLDSSSLLTGGVLSISADSQHFNITAGTGVIIDAHTDPANPTSTSVAWDEMLDVVPLYIGSGTTSYIGIDSTGAIVQWDENYYTDAERRHYIIIGWLNHVDLTYIDAVYQEPIFSADLANQFMDFFDNFGPFNITGNEYSYFTDLALHRTEGKVFDAASNYQNDRSNPNIIGSDDEDSCPIYYSYRTGPGVWYNNPVPTTSIDPNNYDNGTALTPIASGKFTIQIITYYAIWGSTDIQYGQVEYDTLVAAQAAVNDVVELNPYNSGYDVFRAWLIVKQGTTDLSVAADAMFISAGRLGLFASAAGGGNTGSLTDANNAGTGGTGWYDSKVGPTLQFKNAYAVAPLAISEVTASKRLEFSMPLANSTQAGYLGTSAYQDFSSRALSDHSHGNPTLSLTNLSGTTASASNGVTFSISASAFNSASCMNTSERGNYFYTSNNTFANSTHSHGNPTLSLTNVSGTTASNSGGVTFSLSVAASFNSASCVNTSERGNYFYTSNNTFANSTHSHGNPTLALTNILGTTASNSSGLTLSLSVSPGGAGDGGNIIAASNSTAASTGTILFQTGNGITFGLNGSTITASYASDHSHGNPTLALTNITGTTASASNGLTLSLSGVASFNSASCMNTSERGNYFYTSNNTFANSTHSHGNPTLSLTNISGTTASASSGVTFSLSAADSFNSASCMNTSERANYFYTSNNTFANSTHSHGNPVLSLTNITGTTASNSSGFTLSLSAGGGAGDGGNVLAAAGSTAASTGTIVFSNLNGVSFGLNGSTMTASIGAAPSAGIGAVVASNTTFTSGTIYFSGANLTVSQSVNGASQYVQLTAPAVSSLGNANGITFGVNGSTITASYASDHSHGNPTLALTNLTGTTASASNGLTISLSAAAPGGGAGFTLSYYEPYPIHNTGTGIISAATGTSGSCTFFPFHFNNPVAFDFIGMLLSMNFTTGGTSAFTQARTMQWGLYSLSNGSTLNRIGSSSLGMSCTYNNSNITMSHPMTTASNAFTYQTTSSAGLNITSAYTGLKVFQVPFATSLSQGMYWLGIFNRQLTTGFNSGVLMSHYGNSCSITNVAPIGKYSSAYTAGTNLEGGLFGFLDGPYVFTSAGQTDLPSTAQISAMSENVPVIPYMRFWQT